jgi:hypothetical protein
MVLLLVFKAKDFDNACPDILGARNILIEGNVLAIEAYGGLAALKHLRLLLYGGDKEVTPPWLMAPLAALGTPANILSK